MPIDEPSAATLAVEAALVLGEAVVSVEELAHGTRLTATRRVCRVRTATRRAVVKLVAVNANDGHPRDPAQLDFPPREPLLYARGLPDAYREAGIAMPDLLARFDRPGAVALWMEDLGGVSGSALAPSDYGHVARRLGRAQGRSIAEAGSADAFPWSRMFLPDFLASWSDVGWERVLDDDAWAAPLIAAHFSAEDRRRLVALCANRHQMLTWAERVPHAICHHDVWPNNVFAYDDHTTLVDWAFAGYGPIGADVGNLVTDSCGDLLQPASLLAELDATSADAYRAGLDDAGWTGDFSWARLGMCVLAAKWCWLVPHMLRLANHADHDVYGGVTVDSDHLFSERAAMLRYYTVLADEARALAGSLGL